MVEARFARVKYAMIAEVMRDNGAGEYPADLIEKELVRLNRLADPSEKSREDLPIASKPAEEKANEITADIEAKISAQFIEQIKTLSASNREEMNETLEGIREDIKTTRVAILEKVTDVFRPDALKSDHRLKSLDYQTSDRASQTTRDVFCQPDEAQYQKQAQPQDQLVRRSPVHQSPHTPVQQNRIFEQSSATRNVKEPESTAKEDGPASARQFGPRDRNIDSARRTSAFPNDYNMDSVRQTSTTYQHGEKLSQREDPVPSKQVTDSAQKQNDKTTCRVCHKSFDNRVSLHDHLRSSSHYGPVPPLVTSTQSTRVATEASTKPESPAYPSLYRPNNFTETDQGPPQLDGIRDIVSSEPDPAAQLLPSKTLSPNLAKRAHHGRTCQVCRESFESKQQLQNHLRDEGHLRTRGDQMLLSTLPTGPKAKKSNQSGPEKKSQVLPR